MGHEVASKTVEITVEGTTFRITIEPIPHEPVRSSVVGGEDAAGAGTDGPGTVTPPAAPPSPQQRLARDLARELLVAVGCDHVSYLLRQFPAERIVEVCRAAADPANRVREPKRWIASVLKRGGHV